MQRVAAKTGFLIIGVAWRGGFHGSVLSLSKRCENIKPIGLGSSFGAASRPCIVRRQVGRGSWRGIGRMRTARGLLINRYEESVRVRVAHPTSLLAQSRTITQCFLSRLGKRRKSSNKGRALQAQKVLDNGTRRRHGLRQVYRKCHIGMVAVSIIVIFRREKI